MSSSGPSRRAVAWPIAFVALFCATVPARADSPLEEAKALNRQATVEYDVGKFQEALDLYSKAYERYPMPALLFNIGQCHKLLKNYEREIFFFRGYLRAQPAAANRAAVETLIAEAQRQLDDQRAQEAAAKAAEERRASEIAKAPASASGEAPPSPPSPALRLAGVGTAGAGLVVIGLGVYFGLHAATLSNEISNVSSSHGTWVAPYPSDYGSGTSSATVANVLYVTGGVLLATGAVLTYLGWPRGTSVTAAIAPGNGGAQLAVVGQF